MTSLTRCTPSMGVNLWGESPLCEIGILWRPYYQTDHSGEINTRRKQLRGGDEPWEGSWSQDLRGYEQKPHQGQV